MWAVLRSAKQLPKTVDWQETPTSVYLRTSPDPSPSTLNWTRNKMDMWMKGEQ